MQEFNSERILWASLHVVGREHPSLWRTRESPRNMTGVWPAFAHVKAWRLARYRGLEVPTGCGWNALRVTVRSVWLPSILVITKCRASAVTS